MRVLLVEDDIELASSIKTFFKFKEFDVDLFYDGEDAFNHLESNKIDYDLYIIDVNIPNINGLELLKFIRKIKLDTPIIIITASLEIETLQEAFDYGCSEYIKKPFNLKELDIRIKKIFHQKTNIIKFNTQWIYDKDSMDLKYNDEPIELRKKEKLLVDILFKNIGYIVSNDNITDYVWEGEVREQYPVRQMVNTIRKKLPVDIIKTEVGVGYKIETKL